MGRVYFNVKPFHDLQFRRPSAEKTCEIEFVVAQQLKVLD